MSFVESFQSVNPQSQPAPEPLAQEEALSSPEVAHFVETDILSPSTLRSKKITVLRIDPELLEKRDSRGNTPLHLAAKQKNSLEQIEYLINSGAEVNALCWDNRRPIHYAAETGCLEVVKYLIESGAEVDAVFFGGTPIHCAAEAGHLKVIEYLIGAGAKLNVVDKNNRAPIHRAIRFHNLHIVKYLVGLGVDINTPSDEGTPLCIAVEHNSLDNIKYLIDKNADLNGTSARKSPLYHAACKDNLRSVEYLFFCGAKVNPPIGNEDTPLHATLGRDNLEIMKLLIDYGAELNAVNVKGNTPLHIAVLNSNLEAIEYLINKGAEINKINGEGNTILHIAAAKLMRGRPRIARNTGFNKFTRVQIIVKWIQLGVDPFIQNAEGNLFLELILKDTSFKYEEFTQLFKALFEINLDLYKLKNCDERSLIEEAVLYASPTKLGSKEKLNFLKSLLVDGCVKNSVTS